MAGKHHQVRLVKHEDVLGPDPVGAEYACQPPATLPASEATYFAFRLLKRDKPEENMMCWKVIDDA